jgi:hypothetical protein
MEWKKCPKQGKQGTCTILTGEFLEKFKKKRYFQNLFKLFASFFMYLTRGHSGCTAMSVRQHSSLLKTEL